MDLITSQSCSLDNHTPPADLCTLGPSELGTSTHLLLAPHNSSFLDKAPKDLKKFVVGCSLVCLIIVSTVYSWLKFDQNLPR